MSASPFDHPLLERLLGDAEIAGYFAPEAEIAEMLAFEATLAEAEALEGVIPPEAGLAIAAAARQIEPDLKALAEGIGRDGTAVPALLKQLRAVLREADARHVHFGATSQDAIDTSLALRLRAVASILDQRLIDIIERLDAIAARDGKRGLMGHTRTQRARPITVADKLSHWREPLARHRERLVELAPRLFLLQLGGAVGNRADLGPKGMAVAEHMAKALKLHNPIAARHTERDGIAEFAGWLSLITGSLGKLGADVAQMAQNEVGEVTIAGAGGSSAMPEKQNPVSAEILVTLARFNATLLSGMHQALVHESERSGSAWTLEWMLVPQMAVATGAALRQASSLLTGLAFS